MKGNVVVGTGFAPTESEKENSGNIDRAGSMGVVRKSPLSSWIRGVFRKSWKGESSLGDKLKSSYDVSKGVFPNRGEVKKSEAGEVKVAGGALNSGDPKSSRT